jgi:hypothetical protein
MQRLSRFVSTLGGDALKLSMALAVLAAAGLAACGSDAETTVVSTTTVSPSSTSSATSTDSSGPAGTMTADGVGEVAIDDSAADLVAAFGHPDSKEQLPGCELGTDPVPLDQYRYQFDEGTLAINVDSETQQVTSYFTDDPTLETEPGDGVGDSWETLEANWGAALDPIVLGSEKPSPEAGAYKVGPDGGNQLIFDLQDRTIQRISGGFLPPCE